MKLLIHNNGHTATLVDPDDAAVSNYSYTCDCGQRGNVATLRREFALDSVNRHLNSHRQLTIDEIFDLLSRAA